MKAKNKRYLQHQEEAFLLWEELNKEYRSIIGEYESLIEEKRALEVPLRKIKNSELVEFPNIEFLDIDNEDEARGYLEEQNSSQLVTLVKELRYYKDSKILKDLRAKIYDSKIVIRAEQIRRKYRGLHGRYAMDPSCCGTGRKTKIPKVL